MLLPAVMSSHSGGSVPPGVDGLVDKGLAPRSQSLTRQEASRTPRNQSNKRKRADSPVLLMSPIKTSENPEIQKLLDNQNKLKEKMKDAMEEVKSLCTTLGTKAKTETRSYAEKLNLIMESIKEDNLLDSLGTVLENKPPENPDDLGENMDIEERNSSTTEIHCARCKKEILDEQQITESIRAVVEEIHITECDEIGETDLATLNRKWPEGAYACTKSRTGNPLQEIVGDVLLALKSKEDNPYILSKFQERHSGLKEIIRDELAEGQIQFLENTTKTKSGVQKSERVYVMGGEDIKTQFTTIKELEKEMKNSNCKKISIVAADEAVRRNVRKVAEIVFFQSNVEIDVYVPKKESRGKIIENKYDTIVVNMSVPGKSYSDMLRVVRENIDPETLGINIKSLRKRKDDSLLIVTEKSQTETLKKVITENPIMKDTINIVDKKCDLLITGMDAVTTKEEILIALKDAGPLTAEESNKLEVKHLYTNRSGEQVATITTVKEVADKVIANGQLKIGWTRCRVKEKVSVPRCSNCLRVGHIGRTCKAKTSDGKKCLNCTQSGHEVRECTNNSFCNSCAKGGHRADSMSCPTYRKKVYEKERSLAS